MGLMRSAHQELLTSLFCCHTKMQVEGKETRERMERGGKDLYPEKNERAAPMILFNYFRYLSTR